jgi:acyl-homoserine-lactone acylase
VTSEPETGIIGATVNGRHWRRWVIAIVVAVCLTAAVTSVVVASATGRSDRYTAQIRRTEYGIPHILARDYGSLGFGYGYAFAEDNVCVMADRVVTLRGERSQYFDPAADSGDPLESAGSNLESDTYYQGLRQSGVVERLVARPAPLGPTDALRQMVDGYVAGYNRYLRDTGVAALPDPTCRGKAWVEPITALDVWSGIYDLDAFAGTARFRQAIVNASPPAAGAPGTASPSTIPGNEADGTGSNGWALGRDATRDHDGMLLANPHFPWAGYARFYQVQLTIPGVLDVEGASLSGTPVVEIGHTHGVAWTHTVSSAQRYTLFQLDLVDGDPTSYLVDGQTVAMSKQTVTVTVRSADGQLSTVERTLYGSRYGPVLATGWTATTAFAIRDVNADNLRSMNEWLAMGTAQNLAQLRAAQDTYQGNPFTNTIAVDASGTASFADASVVPDVTDAKVARCITTAEGKARYPKTFILDGSTSACNWGDDPGAVQPGIFAPSHVPRLTRTDYVANSNRSPWLTNPAAPLSDYPAVFGDTGTERSLRTRLGLEMIAQRLDGTDGLGPPGFTLPTLQASMLGNRNYSAELGRDAVVAMCRAHPVLTTTHGTPVDVSAACAVLADWDTRADVDSRGEVLWETFFEQLQSQGNSWWHVPFTPAEPLTTPRGINGDDPAVQQALADAVQSLQANHVPMDSTVGSANTWAGVQLSGCSDGEGCFNVVEGSGPTTGPSGPPPGPKPGSQIDPSAGGAQPPVGSAPAASTFGSSFIMAVELTPDGPHTRTILTYSQSANPESPHHTDQTALFSNKQWVTERFTEAEINADPNRQIQPVHG